MTHRHCFEALDRTMRDILSEHKAKKMRTYHLVANLLCLEETFAKFYPLCAKAHDLP
jgi:hypothetical protein